MSDRIKKIKVKKQDGTFSDYIPIGADAENIDTTDGESVQLKLNKKPYYYNNIADMKADTKLKAGDMAITLGYYEANDGGGAEYVIVNGNHTDDGGSCHKLNNNLFAKLLFNGEFVYANQFGAIESGSINRAFLFLKNNYGGGVVKLFKKTNPITINNFITIFNNCTLDLNNNIVNISSSMQGINGYSIGMNTTDGISWLEQYNVQGCSLINGELNNLSSLKGVICLSTMATFKSIVFRNFSQSINKILYYTDMFECKKCTFWPGDIISADYDNSLYQINIEFSGDGLVIDQCHFGTGSNIATGYSIKGIKLQNCRGGTISNCINGDIFINMCMGVKIIDFHGERTGIKFSKSYGCSAENIFLWNYGHRPTPINIIGDAENSIELKNIILHEIPAEIPDSEYNDMKIDSSDLILSNVSKEIPFSSNATQIGLKIGDNDNNRLDNLTFHQSATSNFSNICNKEYRNNYNYNLILQPDKTYNISNFTEGNTIWRDTQNSTFFYNSIAMIDPIRLIKYGAHGDNHISVGTKSQILTLDIDYHVTIRLYRGVSSNLYHKYVDIPIIRGKNLEDFGSNVNGYFWKSRTTGYIDAGVNAFKVQYTGVNATVWTSQLPTVGTWKQGDIIINTDTSSDIKSWICVADGTPGTWQVLS